MGSSLRQVQTLRTGFHGSPYTFFLRSADSALQCSSSTQVPDIKTCTQPHLSIITSSSVSTRQVQCNGHTPKPHLLETFSHVSTEPVLHQTAASNNTPSCPLPQWVASAYLSKSIPPFRQLLSCSYSNFPRKTFFSPQANIISVLSII